MLQFYLNQLDTQEERDRFEAIYYKYRALMLYIAKDILHHDQAAEDAVHDAFVKMIKYMDRIEAVDSPRTKTFVIIMIRSIAIDALRSSKRHHTVSLEKIEDIPDNKTSIPENSSCEELLQKIKMLPDSYRDVLELKIYYELSDQQIADILGVSAAAARKRIERARNALRKALEN